MCNCGWMGHRLLAMESQFQKELVMLVAMVVVAGWSRCKASGTRINGTMPGW